MEAKALAEAGPAEPDRPTSRASRGRVSRRKLVKRIKKRAHLGKDKGASALEGDVGSPSCTSTEESVSQEESSVSSSVFGDVDSDGDVSLGECADLSLQQIDSLLKILKETLPPGWFPIADRDGMHLLLLSGGRNKVSQRNIFMTFAGEYMFMVHCSVLPDQENILGKLPSKGPSAHQEQEFCKFLTDIVKKVNQYRVCPGANDSKYSEWWKNIKDSTIDSNPYREEHYDQTCRSVSCSLLVSLRKGARCPSCNALQKNIKRRGLPKETFHPSTPNIHLSEQQKDLKLIFQGGELEKRRRKIEHLQRKVNELLEAESVCVDQDVDRDLNDIFKQKEVIGKISEVQQCFLEQQVAASKVGAKQMRWHPVMIRFALHLKMMSSSAFEAVRDSGLIKLPCSRTLFDYSHASAASEGIDKEALKSLTEKVKKRERSYQDNFVLLCDEMHLSQNLVYSKRDGSLVGYVKLDNVEQEMVEFEKFVSGDTSSYKPSPPLASKMLCFMVKGVAMSVKEVVASFTCKQLTKDQLYVKTWQVISALEKSSVKIIAFVCDGCAVNRAFMKMHHPITVLKSGLVCDTVNFCSPEGRPLFFISDAAHLLQTIRNCFHNSGDDPKKKSRCMTKNGQKIVWRYIVRLFNTFKTHTLRKSHKLNLQNVFLNSYSCMSVKFAAQIMSKTVALDLQSQNWPQTSEIVKFILRVNDFFDCLNGAHSSQSTKTRNPNLAPYSSPNDERLAEDGILMSFLKYLGEWKHEVQQLDLSEKDKAKLLLSYQTLEGIEITVMGFRGAVKYLLEIAGVNFVNARVFSQDPLEQYFSKQRARGGGSSHPSVERFLSQKGSIRIQQETGSKLKRGNTEVVTSGMEMSSDLMSKRRRTTTKQSTMYDYYTKN